MAIVVKQASNSPLMLGQLAETLANTYLQHNKQKMEWDRYEQDRIWEAKDRDRQDQSYARLEAMGPDAFASPAHFESALADSAAGRSYGGNLSTAAAPDAWDKTYQANIRVGMDHFGDPEKARQYADKVTGGDVSRTQSLSGMGTRSDLKSAAGIGGESNTLGTTGVSAGDSNKWTQVWSPPGGNGETTVGGGNMESASLTGSLPTVTTQEQYNALQSGARYIDGAGKPRVKG